MKLLKNQVKDLRRGINRDYIYKQLIAAITYILSEGHPIKVYDKSTEIVNADFKNFIQSQGYTVLQVQQAAEKVLTWYTEQDSDVVMETYIRTTVNNALIDSLTSKSLAKQEVFKEQLIKKANSEQLNKKDITEHIEKIKQLMLVNSVARQFTLELLEVKFGAHVGICTDQQGTSYTTFIPKHVTPQKYHQLFAEAFLDLGFTMQDMRFEIQECSNYYIYKIVLWW